MQFILNIEKKHFYLIVVMVALVGVVSFVQSQGATFGHLASQVSVDIDGSTTTLQAAIDNEVLTESDKVGDIVLDNCVWKGFNPNYDASWGVDCGDGYLAGIKSYHHNHYEDRRYKFKCCYPKTKNENSFKKCETGYTQSFCNPA